MCKCLSLLVRAVLGRADWELVDVQVITGEINEHLKWVHLHAENLRLHLYLLDCALAWQVIYSEGFIKGTAECPLETGPGAEPDTGHFSTMFPELGKALVVATDCNQLCKYPYFYFRIFSACDDEISLSVSRH